MKLAGKALATVTALLDNANGKRRKFLLAVADVERVIDDAIANPHGIAVRHGGAELLGRTTLCLGVVSRKTVVIGIGSCASDRPTPGRLWKELGPWQQDFGRNVDKARSWAAARRTDRIAIAAGKPGASKPQAGLLAAVLAHPEDDTARLVYADQLIAAGDPRGELITVQYALTGRRTRALLARERALLKKHRKTWVQEAMQVATACELARGFVWRVTASPQAFATKGATLFSHEPLEELALERPTGGGLVALGGAPHLRKLRSLAFDSPYYLQTAADVAKLRTFFASKHLGHVRELALIIGHDRYLNVLPDITGLFDGVHWPAVTKLRLNVSPSLGAARAQLAAGLAMAKLPALRELVVHGLRPVERAMLVRALVPR